jgi:hypothetical protein
MYQNNAPCPWHDSGVRRAKAAEYRQRRSGAEHGQEPTSVLCLGSGQNPVRPHRPNALDFPISHSAKAQHRWYTRKILEQLYTSGSMTQLA